MNVRFKQGDVDSSVLEVAIVDGGLPVDITGEVIEYRFLKPDNTVVYQDGTNGVTVLDASKGKVECVLKSNTLARAGQVKCEVHREKDGQELTTPAFTFTVESSIGDDGIPSTNYISIIEQIKAAYEEATHENTVMELTDARHDNVNDEDYANIGARMDDTSSKMNVMKAPTGFPNRTNSIISFDPVTRIFTISPTSTSYDIFYDGRKITKIAPESITLPNTTGLYFIYFTPTGVLSCSDTMPDLADMIYIANIYRNAAGVLVFGDERHGTVMDVDTHKRLHLVDGTQYVAGLQLYGYTLNSSASDEAVQVSMTNGIIIDEDLMHNIIHSATPANFFEQILQGPAKIPVLYRDGLDWKQDAATDYPFKNTASGRVNFNQWYVDTWKQTQLGNGQYGVYWIIATNDVLQPIKAVQGQNVYTTLANAQASDDRQISWGVMPFQEFKVLYRLIIRTDDAYANARKAQIVEVLDLRAEKRARGSAVVPTAHSNLTGLGYDESGHVGFARENAIWHKNLLHNWDFRNPVNQRGQSSVSNGSWSYNNALDRYLMIGNLTFHDGYIEATSDGSGFFQILENYLGARIAGKPVTVSVLLRDGTIVSQTGIIPEQIGTSDYAKPLFTIRFQRASNSKYQLVILDIKSGTQIAAWKAELGTVSTLANDPPADFGEQLALCQRYLQVLSNFKARAYSVGVNSIIFSLPVTRDMRISPTVTFVGTPDTDYLVRNLGQSSQVTGFTLSYEGSAIDPRVFFTKTSHGLTDATLFVLSSGKFVLSAEL